MKKVFLLLLSFMVIKAAFSQNVNQVKNSKNMYVNINIDIAYKDKDGNDLLDPGNEGSFTDKDITIYNGVNGEKVKVNKPGRDHPNNRFIFKDDVSKSNLLRVFLESEVVLIQLNAAVTDTVKCTIKKAKGNTHIDKVWYNGKLVWKYGKDTSQVITVVK
jgi:hypothetical protein